MQGIVSPGDTVGGDWLDSRLWERKGWSIVSGGWRTMPTESGVPGVTLVRSIRKAGGGLLVDLLFPCHIKTIYDLCKMWRHSQTTRAEGSLPSPSGRM